MAAGPAHGRGIDDGGHGEEVVHQQSERKIGRGGGVVILLAKKLISLCFIHFITVAKSVLYHQGVKVIAFGVRGQS